MIDSRSGGSKYWNRVTKKKYWKDQEKEGDRKIINTCKEEKSFFPPPFVGKAIRARNIKIMRADANISWEGRDGQFDDWFLMTPPAPPATRRGSTKSIAWWPPDILEKVYLFIHCILSQYMHSRVVLFKPWAYTRPFFIMISFGQNCQTDIKSKKNAPICRAKWLWSRRIQVSKINTKICSEFWFLILLIVLFQKFTQFEFCLVK